MEFLLTNKLVLHYRWIDNKKPQTFLLVNSLGTDLRIWDEVVVRLKSHGNILLFDNRGHGLSDVAEQTIGLNDFVSDAVELLDHLKIDRCIVIGLSVGGMIAQILANTVPQKIERLVLCDTGHRIGNLQIWNERIKTVREHGLSSISDGVMQRWFSATFNKTHPEAVSGFRNMLERTSTSGYIQTCEAIRDADLTNLAKGIMIPAICIVGSEDKSTTPDEVKSLADLIRGSRYEVIEGSAHIPCVDNPEKLSQLIIDFINE